MQNSFGGTNVIDKGQQLCLVTALCNDCVNWVSLKDCEVKQLKDLKF